MEPFAQREKLNPCIGCGACCAFYRASFYWAESDEATPGGVPGAMTEQLSPFRLVMKGTNQPEPRCIALAGTVGADAFCTIHPQRSHTCRAFEPSWSNGQANPDCDRARAAYGLPPLTPGDWDDRTTDPSRPLPRLPRAA